MSPKFVITLLALLMAGPIAAHQGAMGIVKERMDGMTEIGKALKALNQLSKEDAVDPAAVAVQAEIIKTHSGDALLDLFPAGSISDISEARPSIWENWDRFEALARDLEQQAAGLEGATTPVLLQNALTLTNQTCAACHKAFRIKK